MWVLFTATAVLGVLALFGIRWAYFAYIVVGLSYFPLRAGFQFNPQPCELALSVPLAVYSLQNYQHVWRFALFFLMSRAQLRMRTWPAFGLAGLATLVMGALVEIAQGVTGTGNCRLRDLVPDAAGALLAMAILLLWQIARLYFRRLLFPPREPESHEWAQRNAAFRKDA
jgi:hypothetical protein